MKNATAYATDSANRNKIILDHEKLIGKLARAFVVSGRVEKDDLMQVGRLALFRALKTWRAEAALWTYARRSVIRDMVSFKSKETARLETTDDEGSFEGVSSETPEAAMSRAEMSAIVERAKVVMLDEDELELLKAILEEQDIRSIAVDRDESKSNADRAKHRTLEKLRTYVESAS